jgi:hypothetical protein
MTEPTWVGTVQSFPANWFLQKIKPESKKKFNGSGKISDSFCEFDRGYILSEYSLPGTGPKIWHEID